MNTNHFSDVWITAAEAAALMDLSIATVLRRIENGKLRAKADPAVPYNSEGKPNYLIRLKHLPSSAQLKWHKSQLAPEETLSLDLLTPTEFFGHLWLSNFLDVHKLLSEAAIIRMEYRGDKVIRKQLQKLAERYGISLSTLYRYENKPAMQQVSKLFLDPIYLQQHLPHTMCLLSADFTYYLWFQKNTRYSQNDILQQMKKIDTFQCDICVYREGSSTRETFSKKYPDHVPYCRLERDHILLPHNRKTINRLMARVPDQMACFCREGLRTWEARYGHFLLREKPQQVNLLWEGDHHIFDCFVRIRQTRSINDVKQEREVLVRPVLTAWMDTGTSALVGWVISILPNSSTIAEAFCRACVFTLDSPFHGLPCAVLTDHGKDYRSKLLEDLPQDFQTDLPDTMLLNQHFAGLGLFPALNVTVHHSRVYHPQTKSIERLFGTIERRWIRKLPGWCHGSIKDRPPDFQKRLMKQWRAGELLTMEEFIAEFANRILPEYHSCTDAEKEDLPELSDPETIADPSIWHTAFEAATPLQRYQTLPKARRLTPDWKTMAIFKMHRKKNCKVHTQGILYSKTFYWDDALAWIVGEHVDIHFNEPLRKEDAPLSVIVIYNNKSLCEAQAVQPFPYIDADSDRLQEHYDSCAKHQKELKFIQTRLQDVIRMTELTPEELLYANTFAAAIDDERDNSEGMDLISDLMSNTSSSEDAPNAPDDAFADEDAPEYITVQGNLENTHHILYGD